MTLNVPHQYFDTIVGHGKYGKPDKPITSMTFGEYMAYAPQLIEATRGKKELGLEGTGKGTSASGAYQFTAETTKDIAPLVLGKDWQSLQMTPQNQRLMAAKLFDMRKGGNLQLTWTSLPNAENGAYANMSFDEVEPIILRGEVGYTGGSPTTNTPVVSTPNFTSPSPYQADLENIRQERALLNLDRNRFLDESKARQESLAAQRPRYEQPIAANANFNDDFSFPEVKMPILNYKKPAMDNQPVVSKQVLTPRILRSNLMSKATNM
jgi:hypothetical protein